MSTILKALRRLEEERDAQKEQALRDQVVAGQGEPSRPRFPLLAAAGAGGAILVVALFFFFFSGDDDAPPDSVARAPAARTVAGDPPRTVAGDPPRTVAPSTSAAADPARSLAPPSPAAGDPQTVAPPPMTVPEGTVLPTGVPIPPELRRRVATPPAADEGPTLIQPRRIASDASPPPRPEPPARSAPVAQVEPTSPVAPEPSPAELRRAALRRQQMEAGEEPVFARPTAPAPEPTRRTTRSVSPPAPAPVAATPAPPEVASRATEVASSAPPPKPAAVAVPKPSAPPLPKPAAEAPSPPAPPPVAETPAPAAQPKIAGQPQVASRAPLPALVVTRTLWHPKPERRRALVEVEGREGPVELGQGDAVGDAVIQQIDPSAVIFLHRGVEIRRRVGAR